MRTAPEDEYAGASLKYVRHLLGAPARWPSAAAAAAALPLNVLDPPAMFSVVFFDAVPHGHCGLYVGRYQGLTMSRDGWPQMLTLRNTEYPGWGGKYLGWVDRETFVARSAQGPRQG